MRTYHPFWQGLQPVVAAALLLCLVTACNKPQPPPAAAPKPAAPKPTNQVAAVTNQVATDNLSVFVELMPPKGRDPFFPNSTRRNPVAPVISRVPDKPKPASALVLKGILGSAAHRLAVINSNAILEVGESGKVNVPGGVVHVKVLEIGEDYAEVLVEEDNQKKRLELNKKGP